MRTYVRACVSASAISVYFLAIIVICLIFMYMSHVELSYA